MSIPNYYNDGMCASSRMKADLKRVRAKHPDRYVSRKAKEQRHSAEGGTIEITVTREPDALPMSPRERHDFCNRRAK